jgi:hypothetical protein
MTTITVPRAVLEQALEALEWASDLNAVAQNHTPLHGAITALRDALPCTYKCEAWPECACAAQQEPTVRIKCTVVDNQHPSGVPFEQWVNAPRREWRSLTNEELNRIESQARSHDGLNLSFLFLEIQQALKEKNNG